MPTRYPAASNTRPNKAAAKLGADYVQFHLGPFAAVENIGERVDQLENLKSVVLGASKMELGVGVGHGVNFQNVAEIAALPQIDDILVGQALISRALWIGLENAVRDMVAQVH